MIVSGKILAVLLRIESKLNQIGAAMAASQADFDNALSQLTSAIQSLVVPVNALVAAVQAHPAAPDFSGEVASVNAALGTVQQVSQAVAGATTPPPPPVTTPGT